MAVAAMDRDEAEPDWGPFMAALLPKQRSYVMFFVVSGNGMESARRAGYGKPDTTDEVFARLSWQLLQREDIRAALNEEIRRWYHVAAAKAVREVHRILDDPKAKDADKLRAADGILARLDPIVTGQVMRIEHEHTVRVDHTVAAVESLRYLKSLDVPREKLIEQFGYSGLARYERMLEEQDAKADRKVSRMIDITPGAVAEMVPAGSRLSSSGEVPR